MKSWLAVSFCCFLSIAAGAVDTTLYVKTSDSVALYVHCSGKGTPVLFLHGGPGSNSGYFEHAGGSIFERDVLMVYLDQRGCGRSGNATTGDYSLQRMLRDFEEVKAALGFKQWMVMSHSFGAIMATAYASRYPQSVKAMVYLNGTVNVDSSATGGIQFAIQLLREKGKVYPELSNDSIPLLQRWGQAFGKLKEEDLFYRLMFQSKANFQYHDSITDLYGKTWEFGNQVWNYREYFQDFIPVTATIRCPVLVIGGTADYTIGVHHPELMRFPKKEVRYLQGGHALYYEHQNELYKVVRPFLIRHSIRRT